jgi:hypothetical protein
MNEDSQQDMHPVYQLLAFLEASPTHVKKTPLIQ